MNVTKQSLTPMVSHCVLDVKSLVTSTENEQKLVTSPPATESWECSLETGELHRSRPSETRCSECSSWGAGNGAPQPGPLNLIVAHHDCPMPSLLARALPVGSALASPGIHRVCWSLSRFILDAFCDLSGMCQHASVSQMHGCCCSSVFLLENHHHWKVIVSPVQYSGTCTRTHTHRLPV